MFRNEKANYNTINNSTCIDYMARYVIFAIDEHSRFVFIDFIKLKSDVLAAVKRIIAAFDATVGTPIDETGRALPRPRVREIDSDREGKLMPQLFLEFRADAGIHHTTSPPHDHDLNPIAERTIGLISATASAVRDCACLLERANRTWGDLTISLLRSGIWWEHPLSQARREWSYARDAHRRWLPVAWPPLDTA